MGFDALVVDIYRYIVYSDKDLYSVVSDIYTSRIACEKAADKFILNNTGKGSRAEVVKVL